MTERGGWTMRFRKLRIASSAFCGLACALLFVLWVRSYRLADIIIGRHVHIESGIGFFTIQTTSLTRPHWHYINADDFLENPGHTYATGFPRRGASPIWGSFDISLSKAHIGLCVPYWFLVTLAEFCGSALETLALQPLRPADRLDASRAELWVCRFTRLDRTGHPKPYRFLRPPSAPPRCWPQDSRFSAAVFLRPAHWSTVSRPPKVVIPFAPASFFPSPER